MPSPARTVAALLFVLTALVWTAPARAGDPRPAIQAGIAAREDGRWGEAAAYFREAVAAAPTWAPARLELAQALLRTGGSLDEIGQQLEHARLVDPDNPRLNYLTGLLMEERREPAQAAAAYEQALALRPSLEDAHLRLGRLLLREGKADEAVTHLEHVVRYQKGNLAARANLAEAYEQAGRLDAAAAQLETIAALYPDNPYHLQRLARFYERHGETKKAEDARRRADAASGREKRKLRPLPKSRR